MKLSYSGLKYDEVKDSNGPVINVGQLVRINYRVALSRADLEAGNLIDNSEEHEPLVVRLGEGELLPGVEEGAQGMRLGATRILVIPPELAFGERGVPGRVPKDATLFVEINISTKTEVR
jgi:FKBP-type peptidyl-prolyl cis-trans isomerase